MTQDTTTQLRISVNGSPHEVEATYDMPLLYMLRNKLGLHAAKYGYGLGRCGAHARIPRAARDRHRRRWCGGQTDVGSLEKVLAGQRNMPSDVPQGQAVSQLSLPAPVQTAMLEGDLCETSPIVDLV